MPGTITALATYATGGDSGSAVGIAFKGPDVFIGVHQVSAEGALEQMVKATGAIVTDHLAGPLVPFALQVLYDSINDQFWMTTGGSGAQTHVTLFDGSGNRISNPTVSRENQAQLIANNHYWCGADPDLLWELDAASGANIGNVSLGGFYPSFIAFDGTNIWAAVIPNWLIQVDEASGTVVNTFNLPAIGRFRSLVFAMGFLWATDLFNAALVKLDLAGNVVATSFCGNPGPLCFDGVNFWTANFGTISVFSPAGVLLASQATIGSTVAAIANDGTANQVWATAPDVVPPGHIQLFEFTSSPPAPTGAITGTFTGFIVAGQFGGGTK